jgi:rhodanese-related sulfurtransferase
MTIRAAAERQPILVTVVLLATGVLAMVLSGAMLLWPLIARRLSPVKEVGTLNVTQLMNHENAVLLDLREPSEFKDGKLPGAVHIPMSELAKRGDELARLTSRPVVTYCALGRRAPSAAATLAKLGFANIYSLRGGVKAWKDAGLPMDPSAAAA